VYIVFKIKRWFARTFYVVGVFWWVAWSGVYRWLHHRKYKKVMLDCNMTPECAATFMSKIKWTKDGVKELWDSCGSPNWVQHVINTLADGKAQPKGSLDCDDFSVWAANVLSKTYDPKILVFAWTVDEKLRGHAVCVGKSSSGLLFHLGNWGLWRGFVSHNHICRDMVWRTGGDNPIGWALLTPDLHVLKTGKELPPNSD
jgi:hypothetical protein